MQSGGTRHGCKCNGKCAGGAPCSALCAMVRVAVAVNSWLLCTRAVRAREHTGVGTGSPGAQGRRQCCRAHSAGEAGGGAGEAWRRGLGGACSVLFDDL